jgi:hypothetical protein
MPEVDERSVALHERDSAAGVVLKVSLETLAELGEVAFDLRSEADEVQKRVNVWTTCSALAEVISKDSLGVGGGAVTSTDDPDHCLKLRRDRDVGEANRASNGGDLLLVVLEGVAVGEDDGDGSVAVVLELLEILGDGGDVERLDDADKLATDSLHELVAFGRDERAVLGDELGPLNDRALVDFHDLGVENVGLWQCCEMINEEYGTRLIAESWVEEGFGSPSWSPTRTKTAEFDFPVDPEVSDVSHKKVDNMLTMSMRSRKPLVCASERKWALLGLGAATAQLRRIYGDSGRTMSMACFSPLRSRRELVATVVPILTNSILEVSISSLRGSFSPRNHSNSRRMPSVGASE